MEPVSRILHDNVQTSRGRMDIAKYTTLKKREGSNEKEMQRRINYFKQQRTEQTPCIEETNMSKLIKCPCCNGTGKVPDPKMKNELANAEIIKAHSLRQNGLTIREVALAMGYKHPGSIYHLLTKPIKNV